MGLKKTERYRGFNIFTEEVRAGAGIAERARWITNWRRFASHVSTPHQLRGVTGRLG
jgi:hypothetical protein